MGEPREQLSVHYMIVTRAVLIVVVSLTLTSTGCLFNIGGPKSPQGGPGGAQTATEPVSTGPKLSEVDQALVSKAKGYYWKDVVALLAKGANGDLIVGINDFTPLHVAALEAIRDSLWRLAA